MSQRERWWEWAATLPASEARRRILCDLLPSHWRRALQPWDWGALAQHLEWVSPSPSADEIPLPTFWWRGKKFVFPSEKGANVSAMEFALADDYFHAATPDDPDAMLHLSACLWRETDDDVAAGIRRDDARMPLHSKMEVEARAEEIRGAPPCVHLQSVVWFAGLKVLIHKMYGNWLFEPTDDDESEDEPSPAQKTNGGGPNFGWWGIFFRVAESGVFGNLSQVHQTSIHDICMYLVQKRGDERNAPEPVTRSEISDNEDE